MPKRSSKPADLNKLAASIVDEATTDEDHSRHEVPKKDAAAVELGRRGGLKGGKARAKKLTPEQRSASARRAARARWREKD